MSNVSDEELLAIIQLILRTRYKRLGQSRTDHFSHEELMSELWIEGKSALLRFDPSKCTFKNFFWRRANFHIDDMVRRSKGYFKSTENGKTNQWKKRPTSTLTDDISRSQSYFYDPLDVEEFHEKVVFGLSERSKDAILAKSHGITDQVFGEAVGKPENTVNHHWKMCRKFIKENFADIY